MTAASPSTQTHFIDLGKTLSDNIGKTLETFRRAMSTIDHGGQQNQALPLQGVMPRVDSQLL
jgi:hypothetical protein